MSQRISRDELLDALRSCVLRVGVRRTTFAEVARLAGVSRMTLYRNFGDVRTGVAELMTREFSALLAAARRDVADLPSARARLVEAAALVVERLTGHELFRRVGDVDAELLLPYIFDRLGGTQRAALALFEHTVAEGQADGSIRDDVDPALAAYVLVLTGQSFVLSARVTEAAYKPEAVTAELRTLLDAYLRPGAGERA
jgi:AcrR family transcriptional regulator